MGFEFYRGYRELLPDVTKCYQLFSELVTGQAPIVPVKNTKCYQCYQLFYGGLLKYRVIEENNRHMIIYFFYNSIIRRGLRACARSARDKDLYSYYIGGKSLCIFMR